MIEGLFYFDKSNTIPNWKDWRNSIPPIILSEVALPVQKAWDRMAAIRSTLKEDCVQKNRAAVVLSTFNAGEMLPATLQELITQLHNTGLAADVFVILNTGGGTSRDFLMSDASFVRRIVDCQSVYHGRTFATGATTDTCRIPNSIVFPSVIPITEEGVHLYVIDQTKDTINEGKMNGLRDIYYLLYLLNQDHGYNPDLLLAIDSDTRFRFRNNPAFMTGTELGHLRTYLDSGYASVGAKLRLVPFDSGHPDWEAPVPGLPMMFSALHGTACFQAMVGAATLTRFGDMVSVMRGSIESLPRLRMDDMFQTISYHVFGLRTIIDTEVIHANRCGHVGDLEDIREQAFRWYSQGEGVRRAVGPSLAETASSTRKLPQFINSVKQALLWPNEVSLRAQVRDGVREYIRMRLLAKREPELFA